MNEAYSVSVPVSLSSLAEMHQQAHSWRRLCAKGWQPVSPVRRMPSGAIHVRMAHVVLGSTRDFVIRRQGSVLGFGRGVASDGGAFLIH